MEQATYLAFFAAAFIAAIGLLPIIIRTANSQGVWEVNDARKTHVERVSSLGGVAIFMTTALVTAFIMPGLLSPVMILLFSIPLLAIGMMDDLFGVPILYRVAVQVILGIMLFDMGYQVVDFGGHLLFNMGATAAFVVILVNAYNFLDGINGLAGSLGLVGSLAIGLLLVGRGEVDLAMTCFVYAGSMTGFLVFNFGKKAKIFMGDNGSTVLGFFMAFLILFVLKHDAAMGSPSSWPILLAIISVPLFDLFKVTVFRVLKGRSPFHGDRSHIHHLLVDGLLSHPMACFVLVGWTLVFTVLVNAFPSIFTAGPSLALLAMPYLLASGIRFAKKIMGDWELGNERESTVSAQ